MAMEIPGVARRTFGTVLLLCGVATVVAGCDGIQRDWEAARREDNTPAYERFLQKYPGRTDPRVVQAKDRIGLISWPPAMSSETWAGPALRPGTLEMNLKTSGPVLMSGRDCSVFADAARTKVMGCSAPFNEGSLSVAENLFAIARPQPCYANALYTVDFVSDQFTRITLQSSRGDHLPIFNPDGYPNATTALMGNTDNTPAYKCVGARVNYLSRTFYLREIGWYLVDNTLLHSFASVMTK